MKKYLYVDSFGNTVTEEDATDHRGMLRDGFGIRQPMLMMDSAPASISDAAAWASTAIGAAAVARENWIADMTRRPARSAEELYRQGQVADAAHATSARMMQDGMADAREKAIAARQAMIAELTGAAR